MSGGEGWYVLPDGLEVAKPKSFSELIAEAIYKEIVGELDKDEVVELNEYEMAFDFGEQLYDQAGREAIIQEAVCLLLNGYVARMKKGV